MPSQSRDLAISSELDLFNTPAINISSTKSYFSEITPVNTLDHNVPIQFVLNQNESHYISLNESFIKISG